MRSTQRNAITAPAPKSESENKVKEAKGVKRGFAPVARGEGKGEQKRSDKTKTTAANYISYHIGN